MTEITRRFALPYIMPAQAQKHVPHNQALNDLDILIHASALDDTQHTPPATPTEGDCHIIATAATGVWAGRDGEIAVFQDGVWRFIRPQSGLLVWVQSTQTLRVYHRDAWQTVTTGTGSGTTGATGANGADGQSAYELAVADGFVGSLSEWLSSLVGPAGADGAAGPMGDPGPAGSDGVDGADGASAYDIWIAQGNSGTEADFLASLSATPIIVPTMPLNLRPT